MYMKNNKVYFEYSDFDYAVGQVAELIKKERDIGYEVHIVTPYRGGLPLGVRLSNQCNVPLSILDYQRLDGTSNESKVVSMMKNAGIKEDDVIYLVDDIADKGVTINKCLGFLSTEFPRNTLKVYTIFGDKLIHNPSWKYSFEHNKKWIQFIPWEGK